MELGVGGEGADGGGERSEGWRKKDGTKNVRGTAHHKGCFNGRLFIELNFT
jgi:hypothetical protein